MERDYSLFGISPSVENGRYPPTPMGIPIQLASVHSSMVPVFDEKLQPIL